jgi:lipid II:glycine glycyltransferase (peptidoglycan interpeptide bridge formation enzyme)
MPLTYGLMWDLILWAKGLGASFFDLGGITRREADSHDPREGISRFKRTFASRVEEVGVELVLEPNPAVAAISRTIRSADSWMRDLGRKS